jgi:hypothetical protein
LSYSLCFGADDSFLIPALLADAFIGGAADHLLDTRKMRRQLLPPRMTAHLAGLAF